MTETTPAERRNRYDAAIRETEGWVLDDGQHMLDAVIAVADAEQAELRTANERMRHELEVMYGGAFDTLPATAPASAPTDQVVEEADADTVTRRATQVITSMGADIRSLTGERDRYRSAWCSARERAQAHGEGILRVVGDREEYRKWLRQAEAAAEAYRLALSQALGLGTGANWEAIRDRSRDLVAEVAELTEAVRRLGGRDEETR
ncbi:hypothetical protein AB0912_15425 [Streptomyces sp. NPDC007084]|uniref:hypothetical protein n=1 Tax=Streptomyces sp. NPDC007084 TaxID=3154313 RepID=UPI00345404E2